MYTVSIIVPLYNAAHYLHHCISSLLYQTYLEIEIILINDGSTDQSGTICEDYASRFTHIHTYHQENTGPAGARNRGMKQATGDYIQFVDVDDTIQPNMTATLVSMMNTGADLAICGYETAKRTFTPSQTGHYYHNEILPHIGQLYSEIILPSLCNKMYRRHTIKQYKLQLDNKHSHGEDLLFNLAYLQICRDVQISPAILYTYHRNENSLTTNYQPDMFANHKALHQSIINFLIENNCYTGENKQLVNIIFANSIIHALSHIFHPNSNLTKAERTNQIKQIIHDTIAIKQLRYFPNDIQATILRALIKRKMSKGTYIFLYTKEILRQQCSPLFRLLQKWHGSGY